ncbi:MAG: hypothetical protein KJ060_16870, partial [Candidatus Hydrogenedentes bacterium]|nr:hypothetical protein [Candidatus Hydrogenedentota bacterium]
DTPRWLRNTITTQSTDRNQRNQYYTRDGNGNILQQLIPPTSGLKLDYNYALADNIALALQEDWDYPNFADVFYASAVFSSPADPTDDVIALYSQGLRREDVNVVDAPFGLRESPTDPIVFDADAELRSYQLALNIMEHRDRDSVGNYAEVRVRDAWWQEVVGADNDPNTFDGDLNPGTIDGTGDLRQITYRMRGVESVRITELMVRPVRRVEAEADVAGAVEFDPNLFSDAEGRPDDFDFVSETIIERASGGLATSNGSLPDWQNSGNGILGAREVLETDSTQVDDGGTFSARNVIQFRFGPSPQLPPGRYYLMFNSTDADGNPTVTDPSDLDFVVKYAREDGAGVGDSDILEDIINSPDDPFLFPTADEPQIGYQNGADPVTAVAGQESGWVFLPSAADTTLFVPPGPESEGYAGVPASANLRSQAFTVIIPPYVQDPTQQYYLYVAIANTKTPGETLAINYFDFSQEPDHEWIEITNIAEGSEPVDVSGWQLQVGGDLTSVGTSLFTIPERTLIAPNSSILLGFNKYDVGADNFGLPNVTYGGWPDVFKNGIGLVRGPAAGDLNDISEPPIPRYAAVGEMGFLDSIIWGTPLGSPAAQSIFYRPDPDENVDFIDSDGDGLGEGFGVGATPLASDDLVISSGLDELPFGIVSGFTGGDASTKAWDRIIELDVAFPDTLLEAGATPDDQRRNVARMVLGGGILPNYPEFDLLDNDFDASVLDIDGIDNDGDGFIDEGLDGIDNDGDTLIDEEDESEGIDEGRFRRENGFVVPGTYDDEFVDFGFASLPPDYVRGGGANLWWDWKNFVELRYFPGESVVVTLYQGSAGAGKIADRVTYSQHDVENRSFDDKLRCPYPSTEIPNAGIEWAWPANTMGIDFYKSLERRHPLFNGDRVGTQNRWLATDGNYDDWHEGTARISRLLGVPVIDLDEVGFGHGFSGSPLRPNFYQRRLEQPGGLVDHDPGVGSYIWTFDRAKVRNRQLASIGDLITVPHMTLTKQFGNAGAEILGAESLAGQGVMLGRDFPKDLRAVLETGRLDSIVLSVATADFYPLYPRYAHVGPPGGDDTLVQWSSLPPVDVLGRGPRAWSPVFLTPLDPAGSEPPGGTIDTDPVAVPVFYPNLTNAPAYPIQLNFLLNPIATYPNMGPVDFVGAVGAPAPRWPLEKRAVMYVSENPQGFEPSRYDHAQATPVGITVDHPSEALFVWDGDDGLPNGEYDLYVVTLDDLSGLNSPTQLAASASDFGSAFAARALAADPAVAGVDIAVLTDVDGDRQVWFDSGNRLPDTEELGMTPGLPRPENYGLKTGLSPASDGSIHYGVVKVENNYLAVFIRNWAPPGTLNRVSRVVLTTRDKTTGRINVNTAITRMVQNSGGFGAYNPLVGMPGIMGEMLPNGTFNPRPVADTVDIEPDDLDSAGVSALDPLALNDPLGRAERIGAVTSRGNVGGDGLGLADGRGFQTVDRLDGRYYQFQSELVALGDNLIFGPALQLTPAFLAPNLVPNTIWPPEDAAETLQAAELQAIQ